MSSKFDIDAYFGRIGYSGPRAATIDTLRALHELHPAAIAFENLSPLSGADVPLDLESVQRKLVLEQRGGWCFEQNLLFLEVLRALGFRATGLSARVVWNRPEDAITPRGHMLLRIELGGDTLLADVGFGGLTLTAPLRLELGTEQTTPHERFRLLPDDDALLMQAQVRGEWKSLYRFDLTPTFPVDYEVASFYLSRHPASHFRARLMAARALPGVRYALADRRLTAHPLEGESQERTLSSVAELRTTLGETFGIRVPRSDALDAALARLF